MLGAGGMLGGGPFVGGGETRSLTPTQLGQQPSAGSLAGADEAEDLQIKMLMAKAGAEWNRGGFGGGRGGGGGMGYGGGKGGGGMGGGGKGGGKGAVGGPLQTPPPNYVCFRCNKPGHFIQACPTNGDPKFDKPIKPKLPVGIPKSMLKRVGQAPEDATDGAVVGGLVDRDNFIVKMVSDDATFKKQVEKKQVVIDQASVPAELKCPVTQALFRNAVLLPCCGASVSDDAIALALRDDSAGAGATCVLCGTQGVKQDEVMPNRQLRDAVAAFMADVQGGGGGRRGGGGRGGGGGGRGVGNHAYPQQQMQQQQQMQMQMQMQQQAQMQQQQQQAMLMQQQQQQVCVSQGARAP